MATNYKDYNNISPLGYYQARLEVMKLLGVSRMNPPPSISKP